ncbi:hypothetical protein [Achromobacter xylosoxidans]|uniref:hypothetical protein n=1 Tax=Alcaligenes xylosoxydans xylosoxydans TaxID=85698 RepID=UPI0038FC233D
MKSLKKWLIALRTLILWILRMTDYIIIEQTEQQVSPEGVPVGPKKTIYRVKDPTGNLSDEIFNSPKEASIYIDKQKKRKVADNIGKIRDQISDKAREDKKRPD